MIEISTEKSNEKNRMIDFELDGNHDILQRSNRVYTCVT